MKLRTVSRWLVGLVGVAIAAVLLARTVQVAPSPQIQPHMGAALGPPKEDQISGPQQAVATGCHRHRLAEALLLVGIPGDPNAGGEIGRAHV